VVPEIYARKAGIIGKIHGATNELNPASAAIARVTSVIVANYLFYFKEFFHIFTIFPVAFYQGI